MIYAWEREHQFPDSDYLSAFVALISSDIGLDQRFGAHSVRSPAELRRRMNALRHAVLGLVGEDQADWDLLPPPATPDDAAEAPLSRVAVYLEDIRSPFNVGSIFRTAAAMGIGRLVVSSACAAPDHPRAVRSAMGAVDLVPWKRGVLDDLIEPVVVLELGGEPVKGFAFPRAGTLAVGSEELGATPELLQHAQARVSIPMFGPKASLNVGVALGIALHEWAAAGAIKPSS